MENKKTKLTLSGIAKKSIENIEFDTKQASDLIEELVDYKYQLNKVSSLNEQIGLNNFFYKIKNLYSDIHYRIIVTFSRLKVGEGIEVEVKDFAEEVAEQLK